MKDELEVYCPKCGVQFKGEGRMFEHLDREHRADKEHFKQLIIEIDVRYLGGHSVFTDQISGSLSLYSNHYNMVVFKSTKFKFEIPIGKIRSAVPKDNVLVMEFKDDLGANQTIFSTIQNSLLNLLMNFLI